MKKCLELSPLPIKKEGGETNVTFNLSGALAEKNKRMLLVDLDQQGNLSSAFLDSIYNLKITVADILLDDGISISRAIQKTSLQNIDIIPSNIDLSRIDLRLGGEPITSYLPQSQQAEAYRRLAQEILNHG